MASYIVLEPGQQLQLKPPYAAGSHTVFVRDEFALLALIMPLVWLLFHRLWWHALMVALIGGALFSVLGNYLSSSFSIGILSLLLSLFVALEGRNWYLAGLKARGYEQVAQIYANDLQDAELIYFHSAALMNDNTTATGDRAALAGGFTLPPANSAMIGLVEYSERP